MTAVEFLLSHMWTTDWVNYTREEKLKIIEQAKEMEKQQIIDAQSYAVSHADMTSNKGYFDCEQYYNETYGSKGNDECREINWGGVIQKMPIETFSQTKYEQINQDNPITRGSTALVKVSKQTSSQTEISDEEIEKGATISEEAKERAKNYMRLKGALEPKDVVLGYKTSLDAQMLDSQLPQTEISDEEIDKAAKEHFIGGTLWSERIAFKLAIKWYRDRIRSN